MSRHSILVLILSLCLNTLYTQEFGYNDVQLTNTNADDRYATYNKDGELILFESNRDGRWQIYTMDINGNGQRRVISSDANDRRPSWHPYKNMILFESDRSGTNEIYTYDLNSGSLKQIPIPLEGNKHYPQFNLNGVELVFSHEVSDEQMDIYRVHKKGKLLRKLVDNGHINRYPKTSHRGDFVLYHSNKNNDQETDVVYTFSNLKDENYKITFFKDDSKYATWPTQSNRILVSTIIEEDLDTYEIYTMQSDGSRKRRLTFNDNNDTLPHWSPNEINILVTREINGHEQIVKILMKEPIEEDPDKK
ncbi:TolB family protein [Winogradskyella sp. A3E31]|uniref:TolB family protein n=1 Tax=Winogradskyella sp. A3E31 TaxID=3349637 RepID=UPI00398A66C4